MHSSRRSRGGGIGLLLLAREMLSSDLGTVGPVTLLTILGQTLLFMGFISVPWERYEVCLSAEGVLYHRKYTHLFLAAIEHADDIHLYHNMVSFFLKGKTLEHKFGSAKFFILLVIFTLATGLMYVGIAWVAKDFYEDYSHMKSCAIGFSGVIFALKVLTTHYERNPYSNVYGIRIPSKYAVWAELVIIHILVPDASLIGHLAGILVGLIHIYGPLSSLIDFMANPVDNRSYRRSYTSYQGRGFTLR